MGKRILRTSGAIAAAAFLSAVPSRAVTPQQADQAIADYNKAFWNSPKKYFYKVDDKTGVLDFWMSAHAWETVMDAYVRTGKQEFRDQIDAVYDGFIALHGSDWTRNAYNDDIMWWTLASARAYLITGNKRYLTQARTHFDWIWKTQQDAELGGGIWWQNSQHNQKNSCVVGPGIVAAVLLSRGLDNDAGYRAKAESLYAWQKRTLVESTGKVYDHINKDGSLSKGSTTYNQGTWIGGGVGLGHLEDARKAADWTKANLANPEGILRNEGQGDFGTFKLICIRYVAELAKQPGNQAYAAWLEANAAKVWANRRQSDGVMGYDWANPAPAAGIEAQSAAGGVALLNLLATPATVIRVTPGLRVGTRNGAWRADGRGVNARFLITSPRIP